MRCPKCGHDNDVDAEFCVNCGVNLRKRSAGISSSNKSLIIVIIVLLGVTCLLGGFILQGHLTSVSPVVNNSTNNTTSVNDSTPNNQTNSEQNNYISPNEAISIARNVHPEWSNYTARANFVPSSYLGDYYDVGFYPKGSSELIGDVLVDADTGNLISPD